jgi:hypothetical protein
MLHIIQQQGCGIDCKELVSKYLKKACPGLFEGTFPVLTGRT